MYPAMRASCSVTPSAASMSISATSQRRMAVSDRMTEYRSSDASSILLFLRMPAVSMMMNSSSPSTNRVSMASRVVPAISETITRSSLSIRLTSEDLPTLGRPTTAILTGPSSSFSSGASGSGR